MANRIVLIGFMASGKTTLGKKLANKLAIPFIDSDTAIEELVHSSVQQIFETKGEDSFRKLENDFIQNYNFPESFVLSTGGGMPCFYDNIFILNKLGTTFYLERSEKELANRLLQAKEKRPLVDGKSAEELESYIVEVMKNRKPFYEQSNFILNRDQQTPEAIIELLQINS